MARIVTDEFGDLVIRDDWDIKDFKTCAADDMDIELTDEQALEAMKIVAKSFDANIGINWEVIQNAIEMVTE